MENSNVKKIGDSYQIKINPKFYALDVVYSAAYVLTEKAYISFDGDPEKEILINILPKEGEDGEKIALNFNNELINYGEYKSNFENNKEIRNMIMQRAIITNDPVYFKETEELEDVDPTAADEDLSELEKTVIPWEDEQ